MARISPISAIGLGGPRRWTIDGVVSGLTLLWGGPGVGKSFISVSMGASVATGRPWLGKRTNQGPVVYIAGEGGEEGVAHRVRAALAEWTVDAHDKQETVPFYIITPGIDLVENAFEFADLVGMPETLEERPRLVVVDTLSRCFVGDENKQEFMGKFVKTLDAIRDRYGCDIIVIHHANKQHELRGSSVLFGAVDVSWEIKNSPGRHAENEKKLFMTPDKLRERPSEGGRINLRAKSRNLVTARGTHILDEFGDVQTTLVIKPTEEDLLKAKTVKACGLAVIEKKGCLSYQDWRKLGPVARWKKSDFDSALSFIVTFPGKWGIMRGRKVGTYVKAKVDVVNEWGLSD